MKIKNNLFGGVVLSVLLVFGTIAATITTPYAEAESPEVELRAAREARQTETNEDKETEDPLDISGQDDEDLKQTEPGTFESIAVIERQSEQSTETSPPFDSEEFVELSAEPVTQLVRKGDKLETSGLDFLCDIVCEDPDAITAEVINFDDIDTSAVGHHFARVLLSDDAGQEATIEVPVFIYDEYTEVNDDVTLALRAENITVHIDEYAENITGYYGHASAEAWDITTGERFTGYPDIRMSNYNEMRRAVGTYNMTFSFSLDDASVSTTIVISIYSTSDWIDVRIPTVMLFGVDGEDEHTIISPAYEMHNYADEPVRVSLSAFNINHNAGVDLIDSGTGTFGNEELELDLKVDDVVVVDSLSPYVTNNVNARVAPLVGTLNAAGQAGDMRQFSVSGTYYGELSTTPKRPDYTLVWLFEQS